MACIPAGEKCVHQDQPNEQCWPICIDDETGEEVIGPIIIDRGSEDEPPPPGDGGGFGYNDGAGWAQWTAPPTFGSDAGVGGSVDLQNDPSAAATGFGSGSGSGSVSAAVISAIGGMLGFTFAGASGATPSPSPSRPARRAPSRRSPSKPSRPFRPRPSKPGRLPPATQPTPRPAPRIKPAPKPFKTPTRINPRPTPKPLTPIRPKTKPLGPPTPRPTPKPKLQPTRRPAPSRWSPRAPKGLPGGAGGGMLKSVVRKLGALSLPLLFWDLYQLGRQLGTKLYEDRDHHPYRRPGILPSTETKPTVAPGSGAAPEKALQPALELLGIAQPSPYAEPLRAFASQPTERPSTRTTQRPSERAATAKRAGRNSRPQRRGALEPLSGLGPQPMAELAPEFETPATSEPKERAEAPPNPDAPGGSQCKPCKSDDKPKKKKKKRKDRTQCFRGTYRETAKGLSKHKLESIRCQ